MVNGRTLNTLAGLTWYIGAVALLSKGTRLLLEAESLDGGLGWPWVAFAAGAALGLIKTKLFLFKSCQKNSRRIANLRNPRWWQFFRPRFFLFLAIVITLGVSVSRQAEGHYVSLCVIGAIDISVGTGLLLSGLAFFNAGSFAAVGSVAEGD
jgi:hypothetical protein